MSMWTLLIALVTAIVVWAFLLRFLQAKPWLRTGDLGYIQDIHAVDYPARKLALYLFLCSISSLFLLFITAYVMRMDPHHGGDWHHIEEPGILWINTMLLVLASISMQWARMSAHNDRIRSMKAGLTIGGLLTFAFLGGQLLAWQQLGGTAHFQLGSPAIGFFYLLTGVHGLHLLGGLWVWCRTIARVWRGKDVRTFNMTVDLCTIYWHYLLLVWFVLFGLLLTT